MFFIIRGGPFRVGGFGYHSYREVVTIPYLDPSRQSSPCYLLSESSATFFSCTALTWIWTFFGLLWSRFHSYNTVHVNLKFLEDFYGLAIYER
jgi:hypothetical protein